jgi:tetratricopeptide (TPR) repeat protein
MKSLLLLAFFSTCFGIGHSQNTKVDSLGKLLKTEKTDSNRVTLLWRLAEQYMVYKPDTSLLLAEKALLLARKINFMEGESRSIAILGSAHYMTGNYPKALESYFFQLKLAEKRNIPLKYASPLNNIGLMYILLEDYEKALINLYRADSVLNSNGFDADSHGENHILTRTDTLNKYSILMNLGETYYRTQNADSATKYFDMAISFARQMENESSLANSRVGIANVYAMQHYQQLALQNYKLALDYLLNSNNEDLICETTIGIAKVFDQLNKKDSAVFYARWSYELAKKGGFLSREFDAAVFLSHQYKKTGKLDSAFVYLEKTNSLKDSIKGQEKTREAMILSSNEQLRQAELAEQIRKEKAERKQQLQLLVLGIFIPTFFLLTLIISRRKVDFRFIRFLGIISLLMLFEYLTLLLHPFVVNITQHTPMLELLVFVCIAAGLIPLHHRLEHWLINKLSHGKHTGIAENFTPKTIKWKAKK